MTDDMSTRTLSLILFRHAKSDWGADSTGDDSLRPLSERGRRAARTMGRFLTSARQVPDLAMTSPAVRAEQTLRLAMEAGAWECPVRVRPALYGEVGDLMGEIRNVPVDTRSLLLVGHEPTWSAAARLLTGAGQIRFPTAAMLRLDFELDRWCEIDAGIARIDWLVVPRLLDGK
jgi:phosphohistidine phosphatase